MLSRREQDELLTVLVVEDDPLVAQVNAGYLEQPFYAVSNPMWCCWTYFYLIAVG